METDFKKKLHIKISYLVFTFLIFLLLPLNKIYAKSNTAGNSIIMEQQIAVVITKKTTTEELEKIKKQMADEGLGFSYSNVIYNDKDEIIAISIFYKDANNNSGNYSVSSENPINTIVITSDGKGISVKSEGSSNQAIINQGNGGQNPASTEKSYTDRRQAMKERSDEMEKEMEERMREMNERHAERRARMQTRRDSILKESPRVDFNGKSHTITKNTTDLELLELQKILKSGNISFYFNDLQRDGKGEITHISITIDNQNGSVSTSTFGNKKDAIKNISIAVDKQHTIMQSAE